MIQSYCRALIKFRLILFVSRSGGTAALGPSVAVLIAHEPPIVLCKSPIVRPNFNPNSIPVSDTVSAPTYGSSASSQQSLITSATSYVSARVYKDKRISPLRQVFRFRLFDSFHSAA
jgi:hypothetical protein